MEVCYWQTQRVRGTFVPKAKHKMKGKSKAPWRHKNLRKEVKKKHRAWNEYVECKPKRELKKVHFRAKQNNAQDKKSKRRV